MRTYPTRSINYNSNNSAAKKEQIRQANLETEERNKDIPVFMFKGFGFRPFYGTTRGNLRMDGPLCPRAVSKERICLAKLNGKGIDSTQANCDVCGGHFELPNAFEEFRQIAHKAYEGYLNFVESGGKIQTLDVPFEAIKAEDQDKTRRIRIKWSQQDGRNQAIIYLISLVDNKEGDKVHAFVDLDREEFRHDIKDIDPGRVVSAVKIVFPKTEIDFKYKEIK